METRYIFVTGGVVSSLGKGIIAASVGRILKQKKLKVFMQKIDPYINIDPGTMSPYQHGEVYVTSDGAETDLDLGHYERFIDENLTSQSNVTAGKIYQTVIKKERKGLYNGTTVQVIPHITDEIKARIFKVAQESSADVVIIEIGGTVGDIESLPFIEAIRQIRNEKGKEYVAIIHTTLIPFLSAAGEFKTKPSQYSVKELLSLGIQPDILACRSDAQVPTYILDKLSLFCNVQKEYVLSVPDCKNIYQVPLILAEQKIDLLLTNLLKLNKNPLDMKEWQIINNKIDNIKNEIKIAIIGKYANLTDAYLSVIESLKIAGFNCNTKVKYDILDAEKLTNKNVSQILGSYAGIIVPGGFGPRGVEGKILAINYARTHKIPFLGLCLGMQLACIEFARNVCQLKNANSTEFDFQTQYPIFNLLRSVSLIEPIGGTLRLGNFPSTLKSHTLARKLYQKEQVEERHRHRYEFNNQFRQELADKGLIFSGIYQEKDLVEIVELPDNVHPFFIASQFHPEFTSRITRPNPLFLGFIKSVC
ncbi:MAG: CTP synthase [Spiroplasma sp.]